MKTIIRNLVVLIFLMATPILLMSQPPWFFTNTGDNHTILIQNPSAVTIQGVMLTSNDYIGVFYDSSGTLACGGYEQFSTSLFAMAAWGKEASSDNGFTANETFHWKIWRASDSTVFNATATYLTGFPSMGQYVSFGMSGIGSLTAIIGSDLAVGNVLNPISGCGNLSSTENLSFQVQNVGSSTVNTFSITYSFDGGTTYINESITQTLAPNAVYIYSGIQTYDFSTIGTYNLIITISHPGDTDLSNNTLNYTLTNGTPPIIDLSGLSTDYCSGIAGHLLTGLPAGGEFSSDTLAILPGTNTVYFPNPGTFEVYYTYTNSIGCTSVDSINLTANPSPVYNLGNNITTCQGQIIDLNIPSGFISYLWSTGSADSTISVITSGTYSSTVTNSFGCTATDQITVTFSPNPVANIQGILFGCAGETINLSVAGQGNSYLWSTGSFNQSINVTTSNTYSVIISTNACLGYDTVEVVFYPLPVVDLGPDINLCQGEQTVLDAGTFTTYLWNDGSTTQTLTVTDAGQYSLSVTDNNSCENSDQITVVELPDPIADFSFSNNNYDVTFTNESFYEDAGSWEWNFGDGTTSTDENPVHTYSQDGNYSVILKISNSCNEDSISLSIDVVDINEIGFCSLISVMPNPSNGDFTIDFKNIIANNLNVSIYNSLGQIVYSVEKDIFIGRMNIETNREIVGQGVYYLNIKSSEFTLTRKMIIR